MPRRRARRIQEDLAEVDLEQCDICNGLFSIYRGGYDRHRTHCEAQRAETVRSRARQAAVRANEVHSEGICINTSLTASKTNPKCIAANRELGSRRIVVDADPAVASRIPSRPTSPDQFH